MRFRRRVTQALCIVVSLSTAVTFACGESETPGPPITTSIRDGQAADPTLPTIVPLARHRFDAVPPAPCLEPQNGATAQSGETACESVTHLFVRTDVGWNSTGIMVGAGDLLTIHASGRAAYSGCCMVMPDGVAEDGVYGPAEHFGPFQTWPDRTRTAHALVGKVGASGQPFYVGNRSQLNSGESGELFLAMNDQFENLHDNGGGWTVTVWLGQGAAQGRDERPQIISVTPTESGEAALVKWTDSSSSEQGYKVFKRVPGRPLEIVWVTEPNETERLIDSLRPGSQVCFYVRPFDAYGYRETSAVSCADLPEPKVPQPG